MLLLLSIRAAVLGLFGLLLSYIVKFLLFVSFALSIAHYLGWLHRFLWHVAESELSKLLNHTPVTIGSLQYDFIRGKVWASNLVIHSPRRREWKWQSPVQVRIGRIYVHCNLVWCIFADWFLWEEIPIDLYTIELSDIQAFVERKQQVFNFYLMDPHVELPDPVDGDVLVEHDESCRENLTIGNSAEPHFSGDSELPVDTKLDESEFEADPNNDQASDTPTTVKSERQKAQKLVDDMVRALARASQQGNFHGALAESRQQIKSQLKVLQTKKKSEAMQEGVKIVQHVSKSLVEKSQKVPQVVLPARRELEDDKPVYGRIGRVVLEDARIFTRDHRWESNGPGGNQDAHVDSMGGTKPGHSASDGHCSPPSASTTWNKPIYLKSVHIRASEFCPPLSAKDDQDMPVVFQTLDKSLEVIWKRILTEVAKSNTGRLFQTAMGEVLDYWMEKDVSRSESTSY